MITDRQSAIIQADYPGDQLLAAVVAALALYSTEDKIYHHDLVSKLQLAHEPCDATMQDVHRYLWYLSTERVGVLDFRFELMEHDGSLTEIPIKAVGDALLTNRLGDGRLGAEWKRHVYVYVTKRC